MGGFGGDIEDLKCACQSLKPAELNTVCDSWATQVTAMTDASVCPSVGRAFPHFNK